MRFLIFCFVCIFVFWFVTQRMWTQDECVRYGFNESFCEQYPVK